MNIVMATMGFLPAVAWGGPVKVVHQDAIELARRGHTITVVATNLLNKHERIGSGTFSRQVDGLSVEYLQTYIISQWPGTLGPNVLAPSASRRLKQLIADADVVHVHATRNAVAVQAMRHAVELGKPIVLQPHGTLPRIVSSKRLKKLYDQLVLKRLVPNVDAFIALQPAERTQIIDAGGDVERIHIVPNGLSVEEDLLTQQRGELRRRFNIPHENQIAVFLARINRKKGTDLLVKAFAQLPQGLRVKTTLVIAGPDDGQLAEVRQLIEDFDLREQVIIAGLLQGDDTWGALLDADIFVLPCRADTFPMAIVEACRARTPIVVTETCEIADVIGEKAATVVPVNVEQIAFAMTTLLQDDELQERYKHGADLLMDQSFSMEAVGDALEAIYRQVLAEKELSHAPSIHS